MAVDRDLLWKAWPDGCLAVRGVSTVGGWLCADPMRWIPPPNMRQADSDTAHARGELLPWVDPRDVATWAAVKADLAHARWPDLAAHIHAFAFGYETADEDNRAVYHLDTMGGGIGHRSETFRFDSVVFGDDALGLVRARIQVREEAGR